MLLLAFDTSTPAVTVALHDGDQVLAEATELGVNRQGELLMPSIQAVLAMAGAEPRDLTHVVSGTGPGPFTGLRVGLVTARALGDALGIEVHGVCSLDALALLHKDSAGTGGLVVMSDARRREVYCAGYTPEGVRTHGPLVVRPDALRDQLPPQAVLAGAGAILYRDHFPDHVVRDDQPYPEASALATIAAAQIADGTAGPADPLYLRRPDAVPPAPRKQVTPA
ncbi:tRNA (adenosine(37)-N6)-threonylcarbamoyltransferase complex dimerization subunit type 1 TsaB [Acidothermaceae bacterium B102]|nr:tRNA (adenosine(37)-N6)-threonylcarbamoyltransferase complex dimerization subunit type 1 TsaB [Acidothermaceae bacterium B102]